MRLKTLLATLNWRGVFLNSSEFNSLSKILDQTGLSGFLDELDPELRQRFAECPDWVERGRRELEFCEKNKIKVSVYGDKDYPQAYLKLAYPPLILTYQGNLKQNTRGSICVLGSRKQFNCTEKWLDLHFAQFLRDYRATVVSGGAYGVDQTAHSCAIRAGRPTLCFLPSGLNRLYPKTLHRFRLAILDGGGALVSQFSPLGDLYKSNFHSRNELMVHYSDLVFVAQAGIRSGSMVSAKLAMYADKPLVTLPFASSQMEGAGSLELIANGCPFVRNAKELKEHWKQALDARFFHSVGTKSEE